MPGSDNALVCFCELQKIAEADILLPDRLGFDQAGPVGFHLAAQGRILGAGIDVGGNRFLDIADADDK